MWEVNGNDIFEDNTYSWHAWSAEILQAPAEVYDRFAQMNLFNKKIAKIRAIGFGYNLRYDYFEDDFENDPDPTDINSSPSERTLPRVVEIDEPLIIVFEDGERLEIDFSEGSSIRISQNSIPVDIKPDTNDNNFDATQFFSCCIGQSIVRIEVKSTTITPTFTGSLGIPLAELDEYIDSVWLVLSNATRLKFNAWIDYGVVSATDENGIPLDINLDELKRQLAEYQSIPVGRPRKQLSSQPNKSSIWSRIASKACAIFLSRKTP